MRHLFHGLSVSTPEGFVAEEATLTLRGPAPAGLHDPRMLSRAVLVRPNLIVHRKLVAKGSTIESLAVEVSTELATSITGLSNLTREPMRFADGVTGALVSFEFPVREAARVRQFHCLRLDGETFTDVTLTVDGMRLTDNEKKNWLEMLASIQQENI